MVEAGTVVEVEKDIATILFKRSSACAKCGACGAAEQQDMLLKIKNKLSAGVGDIVEVETNSGSVLTATLIVYAIPLLFLIIGVLLGYYIDSNFKLIHNPDIFGAVSGLVLVAVSYLGIKFYEPKFKNNKTFLPVMTDILVKNN